MGGPGHWAVPGRVVTVQAGLALQVDSVRAFPLPGEGVPLFALQRSERSVTLGETQL